MRINESVANMEGVWLQRSNSVDKETKQMEGIISEIDEKTSNEEHDFRALCKKFPNVSFVVVDGIGGLQSEYKGICNTSAFGDFAQISIEVDKEVIENLDNDDDWNNTVKMVQWISDHYDEIVGHAKATSACKYTWVTIHYKPAENCTGIGNLSYMQTLAFEPPIAIREFGEDEEPDDGINEKQIQALLRKIQKDAFDKLFEIGEDKQEHKIKTKPASKAVKEYQEHFVYEGGNA